MSPGLASLVTDAFASSVDIDPGSSYRSNSAITQSHPSSAKLHTNSNTHTTNNNTPTTNTAGDTHTPGNSHPPATSFYSDCRATREATSRKMRDKLASVIAPSETTRKDAAEPWACSKLMHQWKTKRNLSNIELPPDHVCPLLRYTMVEGEGGNKQW
jgi:hypothetical protein